MQNICKNECNTRLGGNKNMIAKPFEYEREKNFRVFLNELKKLHAV